MKISNKTRNILLMTVCYLVYLCSYFLKYSYTSNIDMMIVEYNITKSEAGLVSTLFFISYGIGQFVNAILSKKINIRVLIPTVLFLSVSINVFVFFMPKNLFFIMKYLWCINGFLLSLLWPCTIRTVSEFISSRYENASVLLFGTITAVGVCITYGLSSLLKAFNVFKWIYIFAAIVGILSILIWCFTYKIMTNKADVEEKDTKETGEIDEKLIVNPTLAFVIVIGFISIVCAIGKEGMQTWFPVIFGRKIQHFRIIFNFNYNAISFCFNFGLNICCSIKQEN